MSSGRVLAIDQGTSATKALLLEADGTVSAVAEAPVAVRHLPDGGAEVDPEQLWDSVLRAAKEVSGQAGAAVDAVALANQGETVLAWDRGTGRPLSPAVVWHDRRAESVCDRLAGHAEQVEKVSGLRLDSYFAAPKMTWLREQGHDDGVVTTTDTWLLHRLTGSFVTDAATASRTALLDLDRVAWSPALAELFGLDVDDLPDVVGCSEVVGSTDAFGHDVPVVGIAVDQQAALFAEGCHRRGEAKCTYGTGAFLLANTGATPLRTSTGLVSCVAWQLAGGVDYCLDGQVYTVGSAVDWLRGLGVLRDAAEIDELAADHGPTSVTFVPALSGLAAPWWAPRARGAFVGLELATDRAALVRAFVDGLAATVAVLAEAVAGELGSPLTVLKADGGLTRSRALMQAQADLMQVPVEVYATPHATALGVAAMARLGLGWAPDPGQAVEFAQSGPLQRYEPRLPADEARDRLRHWRNVVDTVIAMETP